MTCFDANRFHFYSGKDIGPAWAFNVIGDARSALPLFARASAAVRAEFSELLEKA